VQSAAFRYISDAITKEEALEMLKKNSAGKQDREAQVRELGCVLLLIVLLLQDWINFSLDTLHMSRPLGGWVKLF